MVLNEILLQFAGFLRSSWSDVRRIVDASPHLDANELLSDWAQANWEILVESVVGESSKLSLEPYGDGADCNPSSSRVWRPDELPTHAIVCIPLVRDIPLRDVLSGVQLDSELTEVRFDRFASRTDSGWYEIAPPFDHVLGYCGEQEVLVPVADVLFRLKELEPA